ncbi:MAG: YggU family protein [Candidatus Aenigmarchaeota archaeon]|nr:YggU family protein [Candidatus Aenigmarchaeota archaeon]
MIVKVKVKPNSKKTSLELIKDNSGIFILAKIKSPPEKGKANRELIREMKKLFGDVKLVSGATKKEKYINIEFNTKEIEDIFESRKKD